MRITPPNAALLAVAASLVILPATSPGAPALQVPELPERRLRVEDVTRVRGLRKLDRDIALAEQSGDARRIVSAYVAAAGWCFGNDRAGDGRSYGGRAIEAAQSLADERYLPATLRAVSSMYRSTGVERDIAISQRLAAEAISVGERHDNPREVAASLQEAGSAALAAGQFDTAKDYLRNAQELQQAFDLETGAAVSQALLAEATAQGARTPGWTMFGGKPYYADPVAARQAVRLFDDAINRLRRLDVRPALRRSVYNLGTVYENLGERQRAAPLYKEAVLLTQELDGDDAAASLACKVSVNFERSDGKDVECLRSATGSVSMLTEADDESVWQDDFDEAMAEAEQAPPPGPPPMMPGPEPSLSSEDDDEEFEAGVDDQGAPADAPASAGPETDDEPR